MLVSSALFSGDAGRVVDEFGGLILVPPVLARPAPSLSLQLHLREKQELFEANSALRQVLRRRGLTDAGVDAELSAINRQVDEMREQEQGVNQVLVLAAQVGVCLVLVVGWGGLDGGGGVATGCRISGSWPKTVCLWGRRLAAVMGSRSAKAAAI